MVMPIMLEGTNRIAQRKEMIREAMKWKAPKMFKSMEESGTMDKFLTEQEREMMSAFKGEEAQLLGTPAGNARPGEDPIQQLQRLEMTIKQIWEEVTETYLEFSDD